MALQDSVRHHLVADVPVGALLSAGIDSGALVGLMRNAGGHAAAGARGESLPALIAGCARQRTQNSPNWSNSASR